MNETLYVRHEPHCNITYIKAKGIILFKSQLYHPQYCEKAENGFLGTVAR